MDEASVVPSSCEVETRGKAIVHNFLVKMSLQNTQVEHFKGLLRRTSQSPIRPSQLYSCSTETHSRDARDLAEGFVLVSTSMTYSTNTSHCPALLDLETTTDDV